MNIFDYLPIGAESTPIKRTELVKLMNTSDREVRDQIKKAKEIVPVINVGQGYYIADDPEDPNLKAYILQETSRIKEISKGLRKHKWLFNTNLNQETLEI
ncbi:MAG: hypothetical protein IKN47_07890 [Lachnospiraceae bacterium]|nr:hypothetical protein [Lachnospiraceae bacterium]